MMLCLRNNKPSSSTLQLVGNMAIKVEKEEEEKEVKLEPQDESKNLIFTQMKESQNCPKLSTMELCSSSGISDMSDSNIGVGGGGGGSGDHFDPLPSYHPMLKSHSTHDDNKPDSIHQMLSKLPEKLMISKLPGGHLDKSKCPSPGVNSVGESETSDYPRSTPSPRESDSGSHDDALDIKCKNVFNVDSPNSKDQGFVDETTNDIIDIKPITKNINKNSPFEECKFSVMAAVASPKLSLAERLALIRDPKIMRSRPTVLVEPLRKLDEVRTVSKSLNSIIVSSKPNNMERTSASRRVDANGSCWFARRSAVSKSLSNKCEKTKIVESVTAAKPVQLIRPPVFNITSPVKEHVIVSNRSGKFSGNPHESVNPFLAPLRKSSYLFGFNDDFECVPPEDLMIITDEEQELEEEVEDSKLLPKQIQSHEEANVSQEDDFEEKPLVIDEEMAPKFKLPNFLSKDNNEIKDAKKMNKKIRFPAAETIKNLIECKWNNCQMMFNTHGKLSDHLKAAHVINQVHLLQLRKQASNQQQQSGQNREEESSYHCLWEGCKVYGKKSCSKSWLEKHVPTHGGKFAFACIVSGCKMRFSSQKILQRHVNSHFSETSGTTTGLSASKKFGTEQSESTKNLKRAGVKLKYRRTVFSARIFDFFDPAIMAGIKERVYNMENVGKDKETASMNSVVCNNKDEIEFKSKILMMKLELDGSRKARVRWFPEDLLDDEWMEIDKVQARKSVKICHLPERAKQKLRKEMFLDSKISEKNYFSNNENDSAKEDGSSKRRKRKSSYDSFFAESSEYQMAKRCFV